MSSKLHKVAETKQLEKTGSKVIFFKQKEVVIFKYQNSFYAVDNACPHRNVPLYSGEIVDGILICPMHGARFDLKTGKGLKGPHQADIQSYTVTVQNDSIYLSLKG